MKNFLLSFVVLILGVCHVQRAEAHTVKVRIFQESPQILEVTEKVKKCLVQNLEASEKFDFDVVSKGQGDVGIRIMGMELRLETGEKIGYAGVMQFPLSFAAGTDDATRTKLSTDLTQLRLPRTDETNAIDLWHLGKWDFTFQLGLACDVSFICSGAMESVEASAAEVIKMADWTKRYNEENKDRGPILESLLNHE